jgi:hypothetical protein
MHLSEEILGENVCALERGFSRLTIAFLFIWEPFLSRCVWLYAWLGCVSLDFVGNLALMLLDGWRVYLQFVLCVSGILKIEKLQHNQRMHQGLIE